MSKQAKRDLAKINRMMKHAKTVAEFLSDQLENEKFLTVPLRKQYILNAILNARMLLLTLKNIEHLIIPPQEKQK